MGKKEALGSTVDPDDLPGGHLGYQSAWRQAPCRFMGSFTPYLDGGKSANKKKKPSKTKMEKAASAKGAIVEGS